MIYFMNREDLKRGFFPRSLDAKNNNARGIRHERMDFDESHDVRDKTPSKSVAAPALQWSCKVCQSLVEEPDLLWA